mmetsp:Transcript_35382/g.65477  ORF Transcript_35382/g.65477 Transcript_35382/m.65477 type:complete len:229 (+) Transcript_35382:2917-3603(+)
MDLFHCGTGPDDYHRFWDGSSECKARHHSLHRHTSRPDTTNGLRLPRLGAKFYTIRGPYVFQMYAHQAPTRETLQRNGRVHHPLFPVGPQITKLVPPIRQLNRCACPLLHPGLLPRPNYLQVCEEVPYHRLALDGRLAQAQVPQAVDAAAHLGLDDAGRLAQYGDTEGFDAVEGLATEEDLRAAKLEAGDSAAGAKVKFLELLLSLGDFNVALSVHALFLLFDEDLLG